METTLKLLLVEDNPGDIFLIKFYLEESRFTRYEVEQATTLEEAREYIAKSTFDLILLDLNLPDSEGIGTLKSIMQANDQLLVIVLTGIVDEKLGIKSMQAGANDFLVKGKFDDRVLNSAIRFAFERHQLQLRLQSATEVSKLYRDKCERIMSMTGVGYWEWKPGDKEMLWSKSLRSLMKLPAGKQLLSRFLNGFSPADRNKVMLQLETGSSRKKEIAVTLANRRKARLTIEATGKKQPSVYGLIHLK